MGSSSRPRGRRPVVFYVLLVVVGLVGLYVLPLWGQDGGEGTAEGGRRRAGEEGRVEATTTPSAQHDAAFLSQVQTLQPEQQRNFLQW